MSWVYAYHKWHLKPKTIVELKEMWQSIWDSLPQKPINKAVIEFRWRLKTCVAAGDELFDHSL